MDLERACRKASAGGRLQQTGFLSSEFGNPPLPPNSSQRWNEEISKVNETDFSFAWKINTLYIFKNICIKKKSLDPKFLYQVLPKKGHKYQKGLFYNLCELDWTLDAGLLGHNYSSTGM